VPSDIRELLGPPPITHLEDGEAYERILASMAEAIAPKDFVEWIWVKDIVDLTWDAARARRARAVRLALARRQAIENILEADWAPLTWRDSLSDHRDEVKKFAYQIYRLLAENADSNGGDTEPAAGDEGEDQGEADETDDGEDGAGEDDLGEEDQDYDLGEEDQDYDLGEEDQEEEETFDDTLQRLGLTEASVADAAYHEALFDMERLQRLVDNANARRDAVLREIDRRRESMGRRLREAVRDIEQVIDAEFEDAPVPG
jgi:hypothetical protein